MKKTVNVFYGLLALVFGLNFTAHAGKTDFQAKLEKHIRVDVKDKDVQPICGHTCDSKIGK